MPSFDIGAMTVQERLTLMGQLWDSLRTTPEALQLSPEQEAELDRRLMNLELDGEPGSDWGIVRARIRGQEG